MFKKKAKVEEKHIPYEAFAEGFRDNWLEPHFDDARFFFFVWDRIQTEVKASYVDYLETPDGRIRSHYRDLESMILEDKFEEFVEAFDEAYSDERW
ncbi:hypothetical protein HCJ66_15020 [Listeria sp. FSL L7-1582]|uniref:hypothetical protein n=1 Tax=Listeria portnoyi TaxID=2713504 RepID=UPI00164E3B33|nr:hypothetical protein [Listeria portnoyi]MBC6310850.1 hypothetical protein [Listeria portnoyi]